MADTNPNKVHFNISNVHYAVLTMQDGKAVYGTPVPVPGAVSLDLSQQGEIVKFYADGIVYYQAPQNNGYQGDLEMALFPAQMMQDIWKFTKNDTDKVIIENAKAEPASFALLFQIDGDQSNRLYCLYNCTATRPNVGGSTNTETRQPQTSACTISAAPLPDGNIQASTDYDTPASVRQSWFQSVYLPAA